MAGIRKQVLKLHVDEKTLQRAACNFLDDVQSKTCSFRWFHPANEGKRSKAHNIALKRYGQKNGVPDIFLLFPRGKLVQVEIKTIIGVLSAHQKEWQQDMGALEFEHHVIAAKNISELQFLLIRLLEENGVSVPRLFGVLA